MTAAKRMRLALGGLGVLVLGYGVHGLFTEREISDRAAVGQWLIGGVIGHDLLLAPVVFVLGWIAYRFTDVRWRGRLAGLLLIGGSLVLISIPALLRQGLNRNRTVLPLDYALNLSVLLAVLVTVTALYGGIDTARRRRRAAAVRRAVAAAEAEAEAEAAAQAAAEAARAAATQEDTDQDTATDPATDPDDEEKEAHDK